jgi:hypothetical protein
MQGLPLHVSLYETLFRITSHRVEKPKPLLLSAGPQLVQQRCRLRNPIVSIGFGPSTIPYGSLPQLLEANKVQLGRCN